MEIAPEDLRVDVMRMMGGGPCGVRITHIPSGTVVGVDDQPSTEENRERALFLLREQLGAV
jgi:peptide chain release factor 2